MNFSHIHDWLHVGLVELWHDSVIELASSGGLELHLVNISILVADCRRNESALLWETLY